MPQRAKQNMDPPELVVLRQFLRAALNDRLAGDEIAALLASRVAPSAASNGDIIERSKNYIRLSLAKWRELRGGNDRPANSFDPQSALFLQSPDQTREVDVALLTDVFGFPIAAAADMLGLSQQEAEQFRAGERARRAAGVEGTGLVIEDDPIIALSIKQTLEECGIGPVEISATVEDAVAAARTLRPDIIVSDYDLGPGGTGVEAVREILMEMDSAVVFVTAYPDRVLTGSDFEPTFVMTKPFEDSALSAAVYYALTRPGLTTIDAEEG